MLKQFRLLFLAIAIVATPSLINAQQIKKTEVPGKVSILNEKPFFTLNVECVGAMFQVVVNGVSVIEGYDRTSIVTTLPVNQFLSSGKNSLELYADLGVSENVTDATIKISLKVSPSDRKEESYLISQLVLSSKGNTIGRPELGTTAGAKLNSLRHFYVDDKGDVVIEEGVLNTLDKEAGAFHLGQKLAMNNALPRWKFLDAEAVSYTDDMPDEERRRVEQGIFPILTQIQSAIEDKNFKQVISLFQERNDELDKAFYLPAGTHEKKLLVSFEKTANDDDLEALELKESHVAVNTSYSGKLVTLERDDAPAIVFNFKEAQGSLSYDIWFRKDGDKWIISR